MPIMGFFIMSHPFSVLLQYTKGGSVLQPTEVSEKLVRKKQKKVKGMKGEFLNYVGNIWYDEKNVYDLVRKSE